MLFFTIQLIWYILFLCTNSKSTRKGIRMDKDLLIRAKEGDKEAMEEILKMFKPLIVSCANRVYISGYDTSDLIQIGYVTVLKAIDKFDISSDSFVSYVKNAVQHNYYYLIRGKAKLNKDVTLDEEILSSDTPEDETISNLEIERLQEAINTLKDVDKTLIYYLFFKGYTLKECAKLLNSSKSTLSRRKDKILNQLRGILGE